MDQTSSTAKVTTDRPARYGKQLVAHLGRRSGGEWSDEGEHGWVQFGSGQAELTTAAGVLQLRLTADPDSIVQLEDVLGRHLVRFGTKDELNVVWVRADGSPGTTQRLTEAS